MVFDVIQFVVLGSGSGGNAAVVECGGMRLMIDAGLNAKQLSLRLLQVGIDPASLNGILLTHEHGDHVRGLKVFLKKNPMTVFTTPSTARIVRENGIEGGKWKFFEAGQMFTIGEITIETFAIQHDAVDPVGFVVGYKKKRLGFLSDAGFVTRSMTEQLRGLNGLFVEANYDEGLLESDTKRPWSIKQRISSRHGHLSNGQVTELIRDISHPALGKVVLGHLSSDCNTPEIILAQLQACLSELGHGHVGLHCARQHEPTEWFQF
jgi:phosphoribosyl 1,2-cyclic phosphodiesterase